MNKNIMFVLVIFVVVCASIAFVIITNTPKIPLTEEEQLAIEAKRLHDEEVLYNQTHGYVVRIEEYVQTYDGSDWYYIVELLDGTSVLRFRNDSGFQLFELGDFVDVSREQIKIVKIAESNMSASQ